MNPIDDQLNRLFRSAGKVERVEAVPAFGLETRVLAAWRGSARAADAGIWDMALLRRGLLVALLIMGASFWPVLHSSSDPVSDYLQASDTTLAADVTP